jgi:stearoyl-CoA desaturase (delta-9 desaturase)
MKDKIIKILSSSSRGVAVTQILATIITLLAVFYYGNHGYWGLSLFVYFCTGCLGVTVTFHRYLSHNSFEMPVFLEKIFSFFGSMGGTGSSLGWVAVHRAHHMHADTSNDPHSPVNGVVALALSRYNFGFDKWAVRDMIADNYHRYLHAYYHLILFLWAAFWFIISPKLFVFVTAVPICVQIWVSSASNIFNHMAGYRNFDSKEKSTNNFIIALISWGEGWHNNHHYNPSAWNFQVKWWEFDASSWVIRLIKFLDEKTEVIFNGG